MQSITVLMSPCEPDTKTDPELDCAQRRRTKRPCDTRAPRGLRSRTRRRLVTRVADSARGDSAGVLDAGASASMNTKQEVLSDQQHRRGETRRARVRDHGEWGSRKLRQGRLAIEARRGFARKAATVGRTDTIASADSRIDANQFAGDVLASPTYPTWRPNSTTRIKGLLRDSGAEDSRTTDFSEA